MIEINKSKDGNVRLETSSEICPYQIKINGRVYTRVSQQREIGHDNSGFRIYSYVNILGKQHLLNDVYVTEGLNEGLTLRKILDDHKLI